mgnify:CR=1 FL=1
MKKKMAVLCTFFSLTVLIFMWMYSPLQAETRTVLVDTHTAGTTAIVSSVYFQGNVDYTKSYDIYLSEPARITEIYVEEGDYIDAGDILCSFEENGSGYYPVSDGILEVFAPLFSARTADSIYLSTQEEDGKLSSPVSGVVTKLAVEAGGIAGAASPYISIANPENMCVYAQVPEDYIQDLELGMRCEITGNAFRDKVYEGTLAYIKPYATTPLALTGDGETVVEVMITIDDPDASLRSGYSARVEIFTMRRDGILTVPYEAVRQDMQNQEYVYIYENGRAYRRDITTGTELRDEVEVCSGIEVGDQIILQPDNVSDGAAVKESGRDEI